MDPRIQPLADWLSGREDTLASLHKLADELDESYKTCNVVGTTGATVGVVGTLAAGALALSPLTGGASALAGAALLGEKTQSYATRSLTTAGSKVADQHFSSQVSKQTQALIDKDREKCEVIRDTMKELYEVEIGIYQQLSHHIKETVECGGTKMPKVNRSRFKRSHFGGKYDVKALINAAGAADLLKIPVVQQGLEALQEKNMDSIRKLWLKGLDCYRGADQGSAVIKEIAKLAKQFELSGLLTPQSVVRLTGYAKYFGIVSAALLPFQIKGLLNSVNALRQSSEHKVSACIRQKAKEMKTESKEIKNHIKCIVTDLSNLVLLINYIKKKGCDDFVDTIMNMMLKEINKARHVTDILNSLCLHKSSKDDSNADELDTFEVTTINCEGIAGSPIKEISMWIWCAWKLRCGSIMLLQNTHFTYVPGIWTLFGVSINCFGSKSCNGVSVLLPLDFSGSVWSYHEFKDECDPESRWNGRCLIANIKYKQKLYSLVNMIAPMEKRDRELFIREATKFVKNSALAPERIVSSVDFSAEIPTMTLKVPKKVSGSVQVQVISKFIPSQPVSEYLTLSRHIRKKDRDPISPEIYVDSVCDSLNLTLPGGINWFHCEAPTLSYDDYRDQIREFLEMGVTDLWSSKNSGCVEFSAASVALRRIVTASRTVHFCVSESLVEDVRYCEFDHIPRILGFTEHSPLTFALR